MFYERDSVCEWPPLEMRDGRVYGVAFVQIDDARHEPELRRICSVGIVQRGVELSYWEIHVHFHDCAFEDGGLKDDIQSVSSAARKTIMDYFTCHHLPLSRSQWGRPIILEVV